MTDTGNQKGLKLVLLAASSLTIMSSATIAPALPEISAHFAQTPYAAVLSRLVLTFPALFIAIGAPLAGLVLDNYGRVKPILAGLLLYAIAGSAGFFLDNLILLLISRAFLGIAVAFIMSGSTTLIGDYFKGNDRNRMMGIQGSVMAGGGVIYILAGGALAMASWRGPFLVYLLAFFLIPAAKAILYEPEKVIPSVSGSASGNPPFSFATTFFIYAVGFTGMLLFYMVPVHIPFILESLNVNSFITGIAIASSTVVGAVVSAFYQKLKTRLKFLAIYGTTFAFMGAGYWMISRATTLYEVIAGLIINGLGMGSMMPNSSTWLMAITPVEIRGRVVGGMTTAVFTGQFLSAIVIQPLIQSQGLSGAFRYAGIFMLILATIFFIVSYNISGRKG